MNKEILIIIPAYNPPIDLFNKLLDKLKDSIAYILIVNDGSSKEYTNFFNKLAKKYQVLKHENNMGKGQAIKTAYSFAYDN